jgi:DNA-directed RNA polymerase subunit alpha
LAPIALPHIECVESRGNIGKFTAEPLEKGIGITIGNALRRILLGYLPGAAVTSVKIEGIQHEFSAIPHMKEDTIEFLLNVRAIRIKAVGGKNGKLYLNLDREGEVKAADIQPSSDFEIINPDLHLATLDSADARLKVEFDIELGEGYREANSNTNLAIGVIPVDAIFTPIRKVNFTTEPVHIGRETSRERLNLEIWTDGTVTPTDAMSRSAEILMQLFTPFIDFAKTFQTEEEKKVVVAPINDEKYNMPVEDLDLSVRTMNSLRRGGITTVGQLMSKGEKDLLSLRNFGQKSRQEVEEKLNNLGLSLGISKEKEVDQAEETPEE